LDQIRRLRLMKDLERSPHVSPKNELKRRTLTSISMTENLRKINKNVFLDVSRKSICLRKRKILRLRETTGFYTKK